MSDCLRREDVTHFIELEQAAAAIDPTWSLHIAHCTTCRRAIEEERLFRDIKSAVADGSGRDANEARLDGQRTPLVEPNAIPGYRICAEIQRGGQGAVYHAVELSTNRPVALKVLLNRHGENESERRRFSRETEIAATLEHPNIARMYDQGELPRLRYLVFELIEGENLAEWIRRKWGSAPAGQHPSVKETVRIVIGICDGLSYAHRRGIVHRDVKPENVVLDEGLEPHLVDFGLAKPAGVSRQRSAGTDGMTQTGEFLGTLAYASPEQLDGDIRRIDTRSDVYSLGVVLYEALTGCLPYRTDGTLLDLLHEIQRSDPLPPHRRTASVDHELETIILKALSKDPDRRYESAGALGSDLRRYLQGLPIEAKRDSAWYMARKVARRYRWLAASLGLIACVICAALVVSLWSWSRAVRDRDIAVAAQRSEKRLRAQAESARRSLAFQAFVANTAAGELALRQDDIVDAGARLAKIPPEQRRWEWYHLASQLDDSIGRLDGHTSYVEDVACFRSRPLAVSVSWDGTMRLWDLEHLRLLETVQLPRHGWAVDISPAEQLVAVGDWSGAVRVYDADSRKLKATYDYPGAHLTDVQFADESLVVASCVVETSDRVRTTIRILDGLSDRLVDEWDVDGYADAICVDRERRWVALALNGRVEIRSLDGATLVRSFAGAHAVDFDSAGARVAYATAGDSIVVRSLPDFRLAAECEGHGGSIQDIRFLGDGSKLLSASRDKTLRLWDASRGDLLKTYLGHTWSVTTVDENAATGRLVSGAWDQDVRVWSLTRPSRAVDIFQAHAAGILGLDVSPDGTLLLTASKDGSAKIWELASGKHRFTLAGHEGPVQQAVFSPSGEQVATASWDGKVRVWRATSAPAPVVLAGHRDRAHAVVFSADEARLYSGGADNQLIVWRLADAKMERSIQAHDDHIHRLVLAQDGRVVVSAGHESIRSWRTSDWQALHRVRRRILENDFTLAVPLGGHVISAGSFDHRIESWDLGTFRSQKIFAAHTDEVLSIDYSPDGERMVSCSLDGTVRLWDVPSGTPLIKLKANHRLVQAVRFTPDGCSIIGGTASGEVIVWGIHVATGNGRIERTNAF